MRTIETSNWLKYMRVKTSYWGNILFCLLWTSCTLSGTNALPDDAHRGPASHDDCPNVTGTYKLYGEALPGMPLDFRFINSRLALDDMLVLDLNVPERGQWSDIHVTHTDSHTLSVAIVGSSVTRTGQFQPGDKVWCQDRRLTIERLRETIGEASTGRALIINQLELAQDGSLIVRTEIRGQGKLLFFFYLNRPPESYGARFQAVR